MKGRLDGVALRVPVVDGSLVDLAVLLDARRHGRRGQRRVRGRRHRRAARGSAALHHRPDRLHRRDRRPGIVRVRREPDPGAGRLVKVFGWYDNEWGYTARLVDLTRLVAKG